MAVVSWLLTANKYIDFPEDEVGIGGNSMFSQSCDVR
jgi:hypothetical protein